MHELQRRHALPGRYVQPADLGEALDILAAAGPAALPIAGGTDLLLELSRGARDGVDLLVDLGRIAGLEAIVDDDAAVGIGALVTHATAAASPLLVEHALPLAQACSEIGGPQLRNRATIVGNVVTASPANDTLSPLLALDAEARVVSTDGERILPVAELITGFRTTDLRAGELIVELRVPKGPGGRRAVFVKVGSRVAQAIAIVHATVVVDLVDGAVGDARIALGSVAPVVVRATAAERLLVGASLEPAVIARAADAARDEAAPIDDVRADARYRSELVAVIVRRALSALAGDDHRPVPPPPGPRLAVDGHARDRRADRTATHDEATGSIRATVNGDAVTAPWSAGWTLLDWLRSTTDPATGRPRTGTKEGCAEGECGACTVVIDGAAAIACLVPAPAVDGASVTTVEGIAPGGDAGLHPLQRAFVERAAVQCGFCTPGFVVSGCQLLAENPAPTLDEVRRGLSGNLCRCTGYETMLDAFVDAGAQQRARERGR